MKQPVSVTVTCWVIIALSLEAVLGLLSGIAETSLKEMVHASGSPMSLSTTTMVGAATAALSILLAAFMLRGANWARITYIVVAGFPALSLLIMYSRFPATIVVVALAKFVVFGFLLFRREATEYFNSSAVRSGSHQ